MCTDGCMRGQTTEKQRLEKWACVPRGLFLVPGKSKVQGELGNEYKRDDEMYRRERKV